VIADAILRDSLERVVEDLHVTLEPFVVILKAGRRHHAVVRHRRSRIVQEAGMLQIQPGWEIEPMWNTIVLGR
jgi:hypothetical protein